MSCSSFAMMHTDSYRRESRSTLGGGQSVKIAGLWKRSQCLHRFTRPNYRHRVFILTEQALSYYGGTMDKIGSLKGRISLDSIRGVEMVDHSAFGLDHTLQIIYHTKKNGLVTLYVTARDKEECDDWMVTLREVCYFNPDMLMHFHSGAHTGSKWSCCQKKSRQTIGCEPTYFLLTKSSSRYAESKRIETVNKLNRKSIAMDSQHNLEYLPSDIIMPKDPNYSDEEVVSIVSSNKASSSCYNLHNHIENSFPSNFSVTQDAHMSSLMGSCFTIDGIMDTSSTTTTAAQKRAMFSSHKRPASMQRKEHFVSMEDSCNRHQIAPLPESETPVFDTFPRKRKSHLNSNDPSSSPLVTATKCYIIQGRSPLSSSSREPSVEKDSLALLPRRKASIEPRISETNPELIHV